MIITVLAVAVETAPAATALPYLLFVALYMGIAEMLVKDIRDVDNDETAGKTTTAVRYGPSWTTGAAGIAYTVAAISWGWFAIQASLAAAAAVVSVVVLLGWITYTFSAAGVLARGFRKGICISLHTGSITVFTIVNASTVVALL